MKPSDWVGFFLVCCVIAFATFENLGEDRAALQTETERAREVASLLAHARGTVPPALYVAPKVRDICFGPERGAPKRISQISVNGNCSNIVSGDGNNVNVSCTNGREK